MLALSARRAAKLASSRGDWSRPGRLSADLRRLGSHRHPCDVRGRPGSPTLDPQTTASTALTPVTSVTSVATSDITSTGPPRRPFVHVIHAENRAAHKSPLQSSGAAPARGQKQSRRAEAAHARIWAKASSGVADDSASSANGTIPRFQAPRSGGVHRRGGQPPCPFRQVCPGEDARGLAPAHRTG